MRCIANSIIMVMTVISFCGGTYAATTVQLVYTNSLNGNIDYCHCISSPNGGLVKRATELARIRRENPSSFFFDTGDFLTVEKDDLLAKYLIRGFSLLPYDAIVPGDQEFTIGADRFLKDTRILPMVCGNLSVAGRKGFSRSFPRYRIIERAGVRLGVIGTIAPEAFEFYSAGIRSAVMVSDQIREIRSDLGSLRLKRPDIIVLLSHSGFDRDKELADQLQEIDVIIGGHSQHLVDPPCLRGKTIILQAGMNGAHIGILELIREAGRTVKYANRFLLPNDKSPRDDRRIRAIISKYTQETRRKYKNLRFD